MAKYKSDITKRQGRLCKFFGILSFLLNVVPALVFVIMGYSKVPVESKIVLSVGALLAIMIAIIGLLSKMGLKRTIFWVLAFTFYLVITDLGYVILIMGICQIIDDILVSPLHGKFKVSVKTNKEIDKRENYRV